MMPVAAVAFLLLLVRTGSTHEEKDFSCPQGAEEEPDIPSTAVCDGKVDCGTGFEVADTGVYDESPEICAPLPYLEKEVVIVSRVVTSTSAQVSWSAVPKHVPGHKFRLAGYFLSGKSIPHSFQNSISARLNSYQLQWLKPWTNYTLVFRPFFTESGKPENAYKLGRAAALVFRTRSSEPAIPGLVSVLSPQQRNVVVNIIGPSAWNSDPVGFHVRWQATSERRGPEGELDIALPAEWSPEENVLNVTLPLPGGMDYRLSVSAVGASVSGVALNGPELEVEASIPLDSYDVSASAIDSSKALVTWRASEVVDTFQVTVYIDDGTERLELHTNKTFEGNDKVSSRHNIIITGLRPWTFYIVCLEGCTAGVCNDAVNTTFSTPPRELPSASVSRIEATSTESFQLSWLFPQRDRRVYDGFLVEYCPANVDACLLAHTRETSLMVNGLAPGTEVSVGIRARIRGSDGRPLLGPAETARVTTWSNVPSVQVENEASIQDFIGTSLLSWTCINSSVDYLQYKITDNGEWTTCDNLVDCDATVMQGRTQARTNGNLRLTHQKLQSDFAVWVRCCNTYGCGRESNVRINSHISGPPSLSAVTVVPSQRSALLRYVPEDPGAYDGIDITWHCNGNKEITYHKAFDQSSRYKYNHHEEKTIQGLLFNAEECEFFLSLYEDRNGRRYYSLPVQAVQK